MQEGRRGEITDRNLLKV